MLDPNPETRLDAAGVVAHPWFRRRLDPELAGLNNRLILARAGLTTEAVPSGCLNSAEVCASGVMFGKPSIVECLGPHDTFILRKHFGPRRTSSIAPPGDAQSAR